MKICVDKQLNMCLNVIAETIKRLFNCSWGNLSFIHKRREILL